nr:uncharacterized protein LOC123765622 [Procambarus clarkii]
MTVSATLLVSAIMAFLVSAVTSQEQDKLSISMRCMSLGRFPHPRDCGGFVDCLPDGEGGLRAREGSCRGRAFHPTLKKCVSLQKVDGCQPRAARALTSDPKLDYVCEGASSEFVCADCKTLVNCVNGTAYPEPCASGYLCATKEHKFGGGVCYPDEPIGCACEQPNQFKVDVYDETHFLFCEAKDADPQIYQCPDDHIFDPTMSQCTNNNGLPECTAIGVFANVNNCSQYYNCIPTIDGWVQKPFSCNNESHLGLMYNEASGQCEDPCDWNKGSFKCENEGRFPDPLNCQRYYDCVADSAQPSGFRQSLHECPEGYEWDPSARSQFGHCVEEGNSLAKCVPVTANKCVVPDGLCNPEPVTIQPEQPEQSSQPPQPTLSAQAA